MPKKLFRNKAPVAYRSETSYVTSSYGSQNPIESYLRAYQKSGTVFGVVSLLASSTAFPEWRLYRKTSDNRVRYSTSDTGSDQRTEVLQHQALKVLNNPNPFMTRMNLFETSQMFQELTGESWWIIEYSGSIPTSVWPVRPDKMMPVPDPVSFVKGYIYNGPNGEQIPFSPNEIIINKLPNPLDMYRGQSAIQTVLSDVDAGNYAAQWNKNYFLNGAEPGGVIQVPNELTDEEFDQLTNRWRETHRGVSRAHRVAILENGMTWVNTTAKQKDMDYVNLVDNSRDKIREAYRVHKVMVGISDDVNRANAQTGKETFNDEQTTPRLNRWRDTLNHQFLPLFGETGQNVEFDYVPPTPVNRELDNTELVSKATAAQTLIDSGFDPHDALEVVGLPDMNVLEKATQLPALPPAWVPDSPVPAPAPSTTGDQQKTDNEGNQDG